ncbi:signal peptidase I [Limnohabitans sp. Bal53]|uniref:signal peptidase I n=1 Tax=Limnohabitans sp. Bal53 TaxID=1977910 RepID=UPI000D3329A8|nr:signal peptidase I [Limnohabitans sp. Bal53]PUE39456.1 signal peptidase I [Limnohabitans sp. Bal53]
MKSWFKDNRSFILFMCCFGVFRLAVADWNPIPSGSMRPTLLEGDVVLVNRLAYDVKLPLTDVVVAPLAEPQRGDVVTFISPKDGVRMIKRLVAVPGDVVEMRDEVLYLNGVASKYLVPVAVTEPLGGGLTTPAIQARERVAGHERSVQVLPELNALRSFGPVQVPQGQYFFLGDNRDNSADSRFIGMVPRYLLIGRAHRVLVSANILGNWLPRWNRTLEVIE